MCKVRNDEGSDQIEVNLNEPSLPSKPKIKKVGRVRVVMKLSTANSLQLDQSISSIRLDPRLLSTEGWNRVASKAIKLPTADKECAISFRMY